VRAVRGAWSGSEAGGVKGECLGLGAARSVWRREQARVGRCER
jgi:hypothetical protein